MLFYGSGQVIVPTIISSSPQVLITFTSDNSNVNSGFNATYSVIKLVEFDFSLKIDLIWIDNFFDCTRSFTQHLRCQPQSPLLQLQPLQLCQVSLTYKLH